ncbi:putative signal transducing protein [Massilia sp. TN1-12]|uniref:putative signal transducing protein n=1 Tax=Massilia paldalensis TaxID=3377675 RepID=UPI00384C4462
MRACDATLAGAPELEAIPGRDLFEVARYLIPMEASLVQGCLVASGIPAVLADAHLMQTDLLLAPALGGVRILAPRDYLDQAQAVLAAFERGEFALGEDADVGPA